MFTGDYSTDPQSQDAESYARFITDGRDLIFRLQMILEEKVPIVEGDQIVWVDKPEDERVLTNLGKQEIMQYVSPYLQKYSAINKYTDEEIKEMMKYFSETLADRIINNAEEYGFNTQKKQEYLQLFIITIVNIVEMALNRSKDGNLMKHIEKIMKVNENVNANALRDNGGFSLTELASTWKSQKSPY